MGGRFNLGGAGGCGELREWVSEVRWSGGCEGVKLFWEVVAPVRSRRLDPATVAARGPGEV